MNAITYTEWFTGDHEGLAPPCPPTGSKPGHLNGMDGVVREIIRFRETVLSYMDSDAWVTRDDQFGVFLHLAEAADELLAVGWPAKRADGSVRWESTESVYAPAEAAAGGACAAAARSLARPGERASAVEGALSGSAG
jgi:hypothetical protein